MAFIKHDLLDIIFMSIKTKQVHLIPKVQPVLIVQLSEVARYRAKLVC
jgi:hypothetical protein